jgi:hypothetical protein
MRAPLMRTGAGCLALTLAAVLLACGPSTPGPTNPSGKGPNYSTVPCADNCGGDVQCMNHCQPDRFGPVQPSVPPVVH